FLLRAGRRRAAALFPYTTLFRSVRLVEEEDQLRLLGVADLGEVAEQIRQQPHEEGREQRGAVLHVGQLERRDDAVAVRRQPQQIDRKSTRLNSSHVKISYAVFCL